MSVLWYDELDSTNAEVLRRADSLDNLSVIAARFQTAGRGQRGNSWHSAPGENLTFTVLVRSTGLSRSGGFPALNWVCALSARNFLRDEGVDAVIKWPNDIYAGLRKICGILVENRLPDASGETFSACGFGINLNQTEFPGGLVNPTSVRKLTGRYVEPEAALERFMEHFRRQYARLEARADGPEALRSDYEDGLFQKDVLRPYRDLRTGEVIEGLIRGVSPDGRLRLQRVPDPHRASDPNRRPDVPNSGTSVSNMPQNAPDVPDPGTTDALYGFKDIGYFL